VLDATPATNADWLESMMDRGPVAPPSTWVSAGDGWRLRTLAGDVPMAWDHPVEGIGAAEAGAFAAWRGGRLPTEEEWEAEARAAADERPWTAPEGYGTSPAGQGHDLFGQVWAWTTSRCEDGRRVLRGGSWASQRETAGREARLVLAPSSRLMATGVRVARSL